MSDPFDPNVSRRVFLVSAGAALAASGTLLENCEPEIDLYEALAMTVPGIVAHESALKDGLQLDVPQFDRPT